MKKIGKTVFSLLMKLADPRNESRSDNTQVYVMILGSLEAFIGQSLKRDFQEISGARLYFDSYDK